MVRTCYGLISIVLFFCLTLTNGAPAATIAWVSEWNVDANDVPYDQGWIDLLESQGYTVDANVAGNYMTLDDDKIETLKAADLIIVSRNSNSGNYIDEGDELNQWNSMPTPMILMTAYLVRNNRWQWVDTNDYEQYAPITQMDVVDTSHPIFAGVTTEAVGTKNLVEVINENVDEGTNTFITFADAGNGTVLARRSDDGRIWIAEWYNGTHFHENTTQVPARKRMLFSAGGGGGQEAGSMNFTDAGQTIFLNAVAYMLVKDYQAYGPKPGNGAADVLRDTSLTWRKGIYTETQNVYFGTDFNDVNEATPVDPRGVLVGANHDSTTFDPLGSDLLDFNQKYYWRVDAINDLEPNSPWKGKVWQFTSANFMPVDGFEGYNDTDNIIYNTWSDYYVNNTGATVGYFDAPHTEQDIVHAGGQAMPLHYDNDGTVNEGTDYEKTGTEFYSETDRDWDSPQDWTTNNVESLSLQFRGNPSQVTSFLEEPAGIFTMVGIGADIFGTADECHFAYKELSGSVKIIARIDSLENTDPFARAGIVIRDTLDPGSRYCGLYLTPENGVRFQYRSDTNGTTDRQFDANVAVPYWVRLERTSGGLIRAYYSPDGSDWTRFNIITLTMANPLYVGLAVTSHDVAVPCEAQFSNVSFPDTTVDPQWASQDIGVLTNQIEPMYVILNHSAVVYHDDPNMTLTEQWTPWNIPLQRFANQGVDLTNITSLGIGIGNREALEPGGEGTMYIDDIRLYRPSSDDN